MTILLDTTVLIDVLRGRAEVRRELAGLVAEGKLLATSVVNVAEVYAGMRVEEEARTEAFLSGLEVLPVTEAIARRAGKMKAEGARAGRTSSLADMLIAATALERAARAMTWNRKDFDRVGTQV